MIESNNVHIRLEPDAIFSQPKLLWKAFSKVPRVLFPQRSTKGSASWGFNFERHDVLYDWSSIATWCSVDTQWDYGKDSCQLHASPDRIEAMKATFGFLPEIHANEAQFANWIFDIVEGSTKRKCYISIELSFESRFLFVTFHSEIGAKDQELERIFWQTAKSEVSCLQKVDVDIFDGKVRLQSEEVFRLVTRTDSNRVKIRIENISEMQCVLVECCDFFEALPDSFTFGRSSFTAQLASENVVKVLLKCRGEVDPKTFLCFEGAYHKEFHPDQVMGTVPDEGFWLFPMFAFQAPFFGEESEVMVYLVQTESDRFLEFEMDKGDFEIWRKRSKFKLPYKTFVGPREKRWGLDKLVKSSSKAR